MHVLDVVEAFAAGARGLQPPPLVILAGIGVLLNSSPLSRRLAFHLQDQLAVLICDLESFVNRYSHGTSSSGTSTPIPVPVLPFSLVLNPASSDPDVTAP